MTLFPLGGPCLSAELQVAKTQSATASFSLVYSCSYLLLSKVEHFSLEGVFWSALNQQFKDATPSFWFSMSRWGLAFYILSCSQVILMLRDILWEPFIPKLQNMWATLFPLFAEVFCKADSTDIVIWHFFCWYPVPLPLKHLLSLRNWQRLHTL